MSDDKLNQFARRTISAPAGLETQGGARASY